MSSYQHRVVPFIGTVSGGLFGTKDTASVSQQLQAAIDKNASEGWEFHSLAKVDIELRPGCLASLLGSKVTYMTYDQLIFRRST